jgi:hypothetical protein
VRRGVRLYRRNILECGVRFQQFSNGSLTDLMSSEGELPSALRFRFTSLRPPNEMVLRRDGEAPLNAVIDLRRAKILTRDFAIRDC